MIKIIMVDDQVILRESLRFLIEQNSEFSVVGTASNGFEALKLCDELQPDIVLMDLRMPECDGIKGTELIKSKYPSIKILVLTTFDDQESVSMALKNGADGYVLKDIDPEALILAIKSTASGISVIHKQALDKMVTQTEKTQSLDQKNEIIKQADLSGKEIEIIALIVDGKSNREIGDTLHFTEGTVKNMISGILSKLDLKDRTQLAVFAVKNHLVE